MAEAIMAQGVASIQLAVAADTAGNLREALRQYNLGLDSFMRALKYEKNDRVRNTLMPKIQEYMTRAEQIKDTLNGTTSSAPSPSTTSPPKMLFPPTSPTHPQPSRPATTPTPTNTAPKQPANLHANSIKIKQGQMGCSYDALFGMYFTGATMVIIEDPYIRSNHQIYNFLRLCEMIIKRTGGDCLVHLMTSSETPDQRREIETKINELKASLTPHKLQVVLTFSDTMHDREIKLNNGWTIKIGRGLDFYTKPASKFSIGFCDLDLRPCLETTVDIFRAQ